MSDDLTTRLTNTLRDWSARYLFVGDQGEFRANTQLHPVTERISINTFYQYGKNHALPTSDGYFVFSFPTQLLRGMKANICCHDWLRADDYLNTLQTRLFVYDQFGKLFPLSQIYLKVTCNRAYLVINKNAFLACASQGFNTVDNVFLTYWVNPHPNNPVRVQEFFPVLTERTQKWATDNVSAMAAINAVSDTATTYTWVMVNGIITPANEVSLGTKDYISIVKETDIFAQYDVTIDDNVTGYESDLYQDYREILHTPKALNPNNLILTHDLADVIVKDSDTQKGLYQSRYDYRSVRQITHQDYSVDRTDVDSLRDTLHAESIVAHVIIRNPINKQTLGGDSNYIQDLYRNDDSTIVSILRGSYISGLDFWKASTLEASPYISLIFTNTIKTTPSDIGTVPQFNDYVNALGFYNTATVLDGGVQVGVWDDSTLVATAPQILSGKTLIPFVFVNGRKLLNTELTYSQTDNRTVKLNLTKQSLKDGDSVSVLLKDFTESPVTQLTLSKDNSVITPKTDTFYVYTSENGVLSPISRSTSTYRTDTVNGTNQTTFYPAMYGQSVIVYPEDYNTYGVISLDDSLSQKKGLTFKLTDPDGIPVTRYNCLDVFINGYWAVYGVDYSIYTDTQTGYKMLSISNRNFLDLTGSGNVVEWFVYADEVVTDDFAYVIDNKIVHQQTPYLFEPNVSEVYGEGLYLNKVGDEGSYLQVYNQTQACVGEHILRFPYTLWKALPDSARLSDNQRRITISNFFKNTKPGKPNQVFMNSQHQVYSPWLQYIIQGLLSETINGVNDPDIAQFVNQFPDGNGLKDADPTLDRESRIDRQYIAVAASYTLDLPDVPAPMRAIIQKLISLTLIRDMSSLGVTPV